MSQSSNRRRLLEAYFATTYWIELPDRYIPMRIAQPCQPLDDFLAATADAQWAFITVCNPESRLLTPIENQRRHEELTATIEMQGRSYWPGLSVGDRGDWPPERSLFVGGMSDAEARQLAEQFGQNAVVCVEWSMPARLVLTNRQDWLSELEDLRALRPEIANFVT